MKLEGKVAIVTGGGSGMGRAIAITFAQEGAKVGVVDFVTGRAAETVRAIQDNGGHALAIDADVSNTDDVDRMVTETVNKFGRLDILCNNAGVFDNFASLRDTDEALWDRIVDIDLKGVFLCSRRAVPEMLKHGSGSIVNTASVAGIIGGGGGIAYTAAKHGVVGLTRALAHDLSPQGIRVNAFCPGAVRTGINAEMFSDPAILQAAANVPIGRVGEPEDMARVALFLASDDSSFSTGSLLVTDGGMSAILSPRG